MNDIFRRDLIVQVRLSTTVFVSVTDDAVADETNWNSTSGLYHPHLVTAGILWVSLITETQQSLQMT